MSFVSGNPVNTPLTYNLSVTAAGATQGTATPITARISYIVGGNGNGIRLPAGRPAGEAWTIICNTAGTPGINGTNFVTVYPATGETITPNAANASNPLWAGNSHVYLSLGGGSWRVSDIGHLLSDATSEMYSGSPLFYRLVNMYGTLTLNSANLDMFGGTGANGIRFNDNLNEGLWIGEGANRYMSFRSTDNSEEVVFAKPISGYRASVNVLTTNYVALPTDTGRLIQITSTTPSLVTLTNNASLGTCMTVAQVGSGQVSFTCVGGAVVNSSSFTKTRTQFSVCSLYVASNTSGTSALWILSGDAGA